MPPLDLSRLRVYPLAARQSMTRVEEILVDPDGTPGPAPPAVAEQALAAAGAIRAARRRGASVMLIYGAHLLRNGAARILERMMAQGWITHLATNGAGTIHDWEYAWFGASTESVAMNVRSGTFGTWHETATNIHLAILAGALDGLGYGRSLSRFIAEDGVTLPEPEALRQAIRHEPEHPLSAARCDLLRTMIEQNWPAGRVTVEPRVADATLGGAIADALAAVRRVLAGAAERTA